MTPDYRDVAHEHRNWLERIASKIPLYGGYKEKETRREADAMLREHLARQLSQQLRQAEDMAGQMLTGPGMMQLDDMGQGNTRLQTLIDKVKTAAQGYAGLFDTIKVKEEQLDALYEFDYNMLLKVEEIGSAINNIQTALDSGDANAIGPAVRGYIKVVTDTSSQFDQRKEAIMGMA